MNNRHPWALKKSQNPGGRFGAELAMLFSWYLQHGPQDFDFFNGHGADYSFELISIETYAPKFIRHNKLFLGSLPRLETS